MGLSLLARWRRRVGAVSVATIAGLAMVAVTGPAAGATSTTYTALGDSYTSAPFVLPFAAGAPLDCLQSGINFPHLVASHFGLSLTDVSCSGATSGDMTSAQHSDQPPQFDALTSSTGVVTLGIGGNDNNTFIDALAGCGIADSWDFFNWGAPCKALFGTTFADDIASDASTIAGVVEGIHQRSPRAKVFVVGYPDILPQSGNGYPQMPLTTGDVAYLNGVEQDLNAMLRSEATANGATFVDTFTPSIGHDACQPESSRWVEPIIPSTDAISAHPNNAGEAADAHDLVTAMASAGI